MRSHKKVYISFKLLYILMSIKKGLVVILVLFALITPVSALDLDIGDSIGQGFEMIHNLLSNTYVMWGLIMIIFAVLIQTFIHAALKKVPHLEASSGKISWLLSLLTIIAMIYFGRSRGIEGSVEDLVTKYSTILPSEVVM